MLLIHISVVIALVVMYFTETGAGAGSRPNTEYISICGDNLVPFGADEQELLYTLNETNMTYDSTIYDADGKTVTYKYSDGEHVRYYLTLDGIYYNHVFVYHPVNRYDAYRFEERYLRKFRESAKDSLVSPDQTMYGRTCASGQFIVTSVNRTTNGVRLSIASLSVLEKLIEADNKE